MSDDQFNAEIPTEELAALREMANLADEALWAEMPADIQAQMSVLMIKNNFGTIMENIQYTVFCKKRLWFMEMDKEIPEIMLAPCGMNCYVCYVHLKKNKPCMGCRGRDESKPNHCRECKIKDCAVSHEVDFCFDCPSFPCVIVKRLDKSYRQRYQVSLIDNAILLKSIGAKQYLLNEKAKWSCSECGGVISLHNGVCSECGKAVRPSKPPADEL